MMVERPPSEQLVGMPRLRQSEATQAADFERLRLGRVTAGSTQAHVDMIDQVAEAVLGGSMELIRRWYRTDGLAIGGAVISHRFDRTVRMPAGV